MNDSFVFYKSWLEIIESNYANDIGKQRELMHNIILYGIKGEQHDDVERMFLQQAFKQIDSAQEKHNRRVEAGRKGGRISRGGGAPKGNKNNASGRNQHSGKRTTSIQQANDNVNVNDNDNDNVINFTVNDSVVGTQLEAVPPPQGWEWITKVVENDGEHYRRARNLTTGEKEVIRLD